MTIEALGSPTGSAFSTSPAVRQGFRRPGPCVGSGNANPRLSHPDDEHPQALLGHAEVGGVEGPRGDLVAEFVTQDRHEIEEVRPRPPALEARDVLDHEGLRADQVQHAEHCREPVPVVGVPAAQPAGRPRLARRPAGDHRHPAAHGDELIGGDVLQPPSVHVNAVGRLIGAGRVLGDLDRADGREARLREPGRQAAGAREDVEHRHRLTGEPDGGDDRGGQGRCNVGTGPDGSCYRRAFPRRLAPEREGNT